MCVCVCNVFCVCDVLCGVCGDHPDITALVDWVQNTNLLAYSASRGGVEQAVC